MLALECLNDLKVFYLDLLIELTYLYSRKDVRLCEQTCLLLVNGLSVKFFCLSWEPKIWEQKRCWNWRQLICEVGSLAVAAAKSLQSCPTLCDPIDGSHQAPPYTGVGCHLLLHCVKVKSESEVAPSCPTCGDPMDCSPPGSSVHGIFQARVLEWAAIAFSNSCCYMTSKSILRKCRQFDRMAKLVFKSETRLNSSVSWKSQWTSLVV